MISAFKEQPRVHLHHLRGRRGTVCHRKGVFRQKNKLPQTRIVPPLPPTHRRLRRVPDHKLSLVGRVPLGSVQWRKTRRAALYLPERPANTQIRRTMV